MYYNFLILFYIKGKYFSYGLFINFIIKKIDEMIMDFNSYEELNWEFFAKTIINSNVKY